MNATGVLAAGVTVSGLHGILILFAFIVFVIAAFVAWFVQPRLIWATLVAAGLALATFALLVT